MVDLWMIATDLINWCIGEREWLKIEKEGERIMSGDGCRIMSGDGCSLPWKNGDELSQRRRRYKIFFFLLKSYAFTLLSLCVLQTLCYVSKKGLIDKKFCCLGVQLEQA